MKNFSQNGGFLPEFPANQNVIDSVKLLSRPHVTWISLLPQIKLSRIRIQQSKRVYKVIYSPVP